MKIINILAIVLLIFLNTCQGTQDALTGKKKYNTDEFLVKKKNPLVIPPSFEELPVPNNQESGEGNSDNSIKKILENVSNEGDDSSSEESSIEESILKNINEN